MAVMRSKGRPHPAGLGGDDRWCRLAAGAGVLAFLIGLALVFVATAPT